jgi:hypothetical protein
MVSAFWSNRELAVERKCITREYLKRSELAAGG